MTDNKDSDVLYHKIVTVLGDQPTSHILTEALLPLLEEVKREDFPKIVCLCGSTRFSQAYQDANLSATLRGEIVLSIGCNMRSDTEIFGSLPERELKRIKTELDELHKRKIDLADEVLILNVGGYIGESTRSEIDYAKSKGKNIRYLEALQQGKEGE